MERPYTFKQELSGLPRAYQVATQADTLESRIQDYYREELKGFGVAFVGDPALDTLARFLIEKRYAAALTERERNDEARPYYYGYFQGEDVNGRPADIYLRMIGLLPERSREIRGTLIDLRGFGHALEHDFDRTDQFLQAGFAVFTPDRAEHGLSSRLDPRNALLRSAKIFVRHTDQAVELVRKIQGRDPRLQGTPLFAIASSLGAAQLIGAMREANSGLGIERIHFDNPLLSFGSKLPSWKRRFLRMFFSAFQAFPNGSSEISRMYRLKSSPTKYPNMTSQRYEAALRYFRAFGPSHYPTAILDLEDLVHANEAWMRSETARRVVPPALFTITEGDSEIDPKKNRALYNHFARDGHDTLRETVAHAPFIDGGDPELVPDIVRFFGFFLGSH